MLDSINEFVKELRKNPGQSLVVRTKIADLHEALMGGSISAAAEAGDLYCGPCSGPRRVKITTHAMPPEAVEMLGVGVAKGARPIGAISQPPLSESQKISKLAAALVPSMFTLACVQCQSRSTAVILDRGGKPSLIIVPSHLAGMASSNVPATVSFYLDQAAMASSAGAISAAMAMFRAALDSILFEQGFTKGMLGQRLQDLEKAVVARTAPTWAMELDHSLLGVIKDLGNGAIHTNDGDITKQQHLDSAANQTVVELFQVLLFMIYEAPHAKASRLNTLSAKAAMLKK